MPKNKRKATIDDGFNGELLFDATFDGILEIPNVAANKEIIIPSGYVPYSRIDYETDFDKFVAFYENDVNFAEVLTDIDNVIEKVKKFKGVVSPDFSLYVNSPLTAQIANVYRNRTIAYAFQKAGIYVICNIRWGDQRSYTTNFLPEKFAFLGAPKNTIVSVGTYGCMRKHVDKLRFREGLRIMIKELKPTHVLVYGSMRDPIFKELANQTVFININDWLTTKKRHL